jgi:hypothetical protein
MAPLSIFVELRLVTVVDLVSWIVGVGVGARAQIGVVAMLGAMNCHLEWT